MNIDKHTNVWYHYGMITGKVCVYQGKLDEMNLQQRLNVGTQKQASLVIYKWW